MASNSNENTEKKGGQMTFDINSEVQSALYSENRQINGDNGFESQNKLLSGKRNDIAAEACQIPEISSLMEDDRNLR